MKRFQGAAKWVNSIRLQLFSQTRNTPLREVSSLFSTSTFSKSSFDRRKIIGTSIFGVVIFSTTFNNAAPVYTEAPNQGGEQDKRQIRLKEVQEHGIDAEIKWVTKGNRVYNITDWIPGHPGGEVILRAVGGAIDQYWDIFTIHKSQEVYDILESYYIGDIDPRDLVDGAIPAGNIDDPFKLDPERDQRLLEHTQRPCNAETPGEELLSYITPNETFYVRNHLWVPNLDEAKYKLLVELYDGTEKQYTLNDLKEKFKAVSVTATLQCSGNRRRQMTEGSRPTNGLQWNVGAISNAEWTGVRLRDVLKDAGFPTDEWPEDVKHVQFIGAESYGSSIPIDKALDRCGDVLLVYEMNGKPLPPDHGYPIRVVVPGTVAARSVKWLNKIILSDEESTSQWQRRDYKCFGPNVGSSPDWDSAPAIQETPVQSAIASLRAISAHSDKDSHLCQVYNVQEDSILLEGYAFSGGGRDIIRVDVSSDDGLTWHQAEILPDQGNGAKNWAWRRWRWVTSRREAGKQFVVKATDEAYNSQPETYGPIYNHRGNLANAWHRVDYKDGSGGG